MEMSVCIITKNEIKKLEKCLHALQPLGFEIVVVDTGSTDDTKQMAAGYTDCIYDFAWCDDFAAAKNYAISMAKHDVVLVLDSDEYLKNCSDKGWKTLEKMIQAHPGEVGRIHLINHHIRDNEDCISREWISRIFDRRFFHYEGRIHEQVTSGSVYDYAKKNSMEMRLDSGTGSHNTYQTFRTNIEIDHDGYDGSEEERRKKAERNIRLLEQAFEDEPQDTYVMYQLGKSCYMAGDYPEAIRHFELALGYDLDPKLEYVIDMVETYGYALLNIRQPKTALLLEGVYDDFGDSADFQLLMGLIYMNNEQFDKAVDEFLKAVRHTDARAEGANSYLAYYNAGVIKECLGDTRQAVKLYQKCGTYEKAKQRLKILQKS